MLMQMFQSFSNKGEPYTFAHDYVAIKPAISNIYILLP